MTLPPMARPDVTTWQYNTFTNGGFWGTASGWVLPVIARNDSALGRKLLRDAIGAVPARARSHCRVAPPSHLLHTRIANIFGACLSETTMRPKPRCGATAR